MAVDTKQKRQSALNFLRSFSLRLQFPDGTIDQGDRQTSLISYSGILAIPAVLWRNKNASSDTWLGKNDSSGTWVNKGAGSATWLKRNDT